MRLRKLKEKVKSRKKIIDKCIKESALAFCKSYLQNIGSNLSYDINVTSNECLQLGRNQDLCYDRPSIGLSYSLWYQGKRINAFLSYLTDLLYENIGKNNEIVVLDLGAGTGAVQCSCSIIYSSMREIGIEAPSIRIINIDTSPFMLKYNLDFLWPELKSNLPFLDEIKVSYNVNSWDKTDYIKNKNLWISASYLFDHSEEIESLRKNFLELINLYSPEKIFLTSSINKRHLTDSLATEMKSYDYNIINNFQTNFYSGSMVECKFARTKINKKIGTSFFGTPKWGEENIHGLILEKDSESFVPDMFGQENSAPINLYTPKVIVRRDILLNKLQGLAAKHDGKPTIITGPAGCGKSIVITERIMDVINLYRLQGKLLETNILISTFNKELKGQLLDWLSDLLNKEKIKHVIKGNGIYFEDSQSLNITYLHFDTLPTRVWHKYSKKDYPFNNEQLILDYDQKLILEKIIKKVRDKFGLKDTEQSRILDPLFILDEYHRVVYGKNCFIKDTYANVDRKGRGTPLGKNQREIVFYAINQFLRELEATNKATPITRRHKLYKKLKKGDMNKIYDHIFVDEFQDCTQTDFQIFYHMILDPNNFVIAGDYAQAIHLGASSDIPRDNDMSKRVTHKLIGSYRLPYRISECIQELSKKINTNRGDNMVDILSPYKGAPPGARPILVYLNDQEDIGQKLINIINAYDCFDFKEITVLEKDPELVSKLNMSDSISYKAETDTILKLKGLEKGCLIWSTRIKINDIEETENFVYTILTRTSGILIIAIFEDTHESYFDIIRGFRKDRIIIWDKDTEDFYNSNI